MFSGGHTGPPLRRFNKTHRQIIKESHKDTANNVYSQQKGAVFMIKPGRYRHFKGKEYQVLGTAKHSETLEEMVVYRQLYGEHGLWVRPASMWEETVERDGKTYQRFTYIG